MAASDPLVPSSSVRPSSSDRSDRSSSPSDDRAVAGVPLADVRMEYRQGGLVESDLAHDPFDQFNRWLHEARTTHQPGMDEPHAMTLSTATADGVPSSRTVLLKGVDHDGFVWFTNYGSRKGQDLAENPRAALNFRWGAFERQVCVVGFVEKVSGEESDAYFASRPIGSRIGAIVSAQSSVLPDRATIEAAADQLASLSPDELVRPAHWGGYRLRPSTIEFWQGRPSRLHDRLRFRRATLDDPWTLERLAP